MVFLGLVMMPFYYGAKVRSVPEYLRLRFNEPTHAFNAATFAVATVLISGVNLYALALIIHLMLGWSVADRDRRGRRARCSSTSPLGGLTSAIYDEVLQFFIIVAALLPLTIVASIPSAAFMGSSKRSGPSTCSVTPASHVARGWDPPRDEPAAVRSGWCLFGLGLWLLSVTGRPTSPRFSERSRLATCQLPAGPR